MKLGERRTNAPRVYPFSRWSIKQNEPSMDAEAQVLALVKILQDKIPTLLEIKEKYDVCFTMSVVPHIFNELSPNIGFKQEVIAFCYKTGAEIVVDTYVFDK